MPYNGSGVFVRLRSWVNDAASNIKIRADFHDSEDDNLASGLTQCITRDGQSTITANLPMSGYRHTGVGVANADTQYAVVSQVQSGVYLSADDTGIVNAYAINPSVAVTAYTDNMTLSFIPANTNTGAATLNVSLLGAKAIKVGTATLTAGQLAAGRSYTVQYDGTDFQLSAGTNGVFSDSDFRIFDNTDVTKRLGFEVSPIATATTRTLTVQDKSGILPVIETADILIPGTSAGPSSITFSEDTDNGTNTVKIIAPSSVASNKTLTLPDETGTVVSTASLPSTYLPTGAVIQTLQGVNSSTLTSTSASWTDIATVTITPARTSNKVLVQASVMGLQSSGTGVGYLRLSRDSTGIGLGDAAGSRIQCGCYLTRVGSDNTSAASHSLSFLDSPASAVAITYRVQVYEVGGTAYINRSPDDPNNTAGGRGVTTITVSEIVA